MPSERSIFISYRREDSADVTGRIYDQLIGAFGREAIFKDVDNIPFGVDFRTHLDQAVSQCDILLAVVGRTWINATDAEGNQRLQNPGDYVRIEIEAALKRNIPVVPLLVRNAVMPTAAQLPESLAELAYRNGTPVRRDPDFHTDMERLIIGLQDLLGPSQAEETPASVPQPSQPMATADPVEPPELLSPPSTPPTYTPPTLKQGLVTRPQPIDSQPIDSQPTDSQPMAPLAAPTPTPGQSANSKRNLIIAGIAGVVGVVGLVAVIFASRNPSPDSGTATINPDGTRLVIDETSPDCREIRPSNGGTIAKVRQSPQKEATVLDTVNRGELAKSLDAQGAFEELQFEGDVQGWVFNSEMVSCLTQTGAPPSTKPTSPKPVPEPEWPEPEEEDHSPDEDPPPSDDPTPGGGTGPTDLTSP